MGLFSVFKRKRRTLQASFTSYKNPRFSSRKPFVPKVSRIEDRSNRRRGEKWGSFFRYLEILAGLALLGGLAYGVFFTSWFQIQNVEVKGEADTAAEQAAIKEALQKYLGENLLFFGASDEEKLLLENFAYLKTLDIQRNFFHTITVVVETYPAVANIRMEFDDGSTEYYVVNEQGYIASIGTTLQDLPLIVMDVTGTDVDLPVAEVETPAEETPTEESTEESSEEPAPRTHPKIGRASCRERV